MLLFSLIQLPTIHLPMNLKLMSQILPIARLVSIIKGFAGEKILSFFDLKLASITKR